MKTINRGFFSRFTKFVIILILIFFFYNLGFSWNRKYFFLGGVCFEKSVADTRIGQTFIQLVSDCWWVDGKESNSIEEFVGTWSCSIFFTLEFREWNTRKKAWPTPKFCGWCLSLSVTMMFWIRVWFVKVKRIWERRGAYILVAKRVPD